MINTPNVFCQIEGQSVPTNAPLGRQSPFKVTPEPFHSVDDVRPELREFEQELKEEREALKRVLAGTEQALALTMEKRDPYTAGHQHRVSKLVGAIAKEMGFLPNEVEWMRTASLLHDIGKITVPIEILSRPGRLSDSEFDIVRTHPQVGYEILNEVTFPWPVAQVVLQHHEHLDGSGYPAGLREDAILRETRILTVADVVEAMSSHRPYRPAHDFSKVLEEVRRFRGTRYDPAVVASCLKVFFDRGFRFENTETESARRNVL